MKLFFLLIFLIVIPEFLKAQVNPLPSPEQMHAILLERAELNHSAGGLTLLTGLGLTVGGGILILKDFINTDQAGTAGPVLMVGGIAAIITSVHLFNAGNYNKRMAEFALQRKTSWIGNKPVSYTALAVNIKF